MGDKNLKALAKQRAKKDVDDDGRDGNLRAHSAGKGLKDRNYGFRKADWAGRSAKTAKDTPTERMSYIGGDYDGVEIEAGRSKSRDLIAWPVVKQYEKEKDSAGNVNELGEARELDDDLDDHETKNKRVKQRRKFGMLKQMLGQFDEMDRNGNGIPDSEE